MPKRKLKKKPKVKIHPNRLWCAEFDDELLFADGFDDCIIGVSSGIEQTVVYDKDLMVEELRSQGMDEIDAIEYLEYNTWGAYVGEKTPIYITLKK